MPRFFLFCFFFWGGGFGGGFAFFLLFFFGGFGGQMDGESWRTWLFHILPGPSISPKAHLCKDYCPLEHAPIGGLPKNVPEQEYRSP